MKVIPTGSPAARPPSLHLSGADGWAWPWQVQKALPVRTSKEVPEHTQNCQPSRREAEKRLCVQPYRFP